MDNPSFVTNDESQNDEKDDPNKHSAHIYENNEYSDDNSLLDSNEKSSSSVIIQNHLATDYTESPRTKLARFVPEVPFKINGNITPLCDSKIFVVKSLETSNGHKSLQVSVSMEDEFEDNDQIYSKSCDCSEDMFESLQQRTSTISRSLSEDFLQRPTANYQRRVSIVSSSKGKLMGVPRVRPGEKLVRSPSNVSAGQISSKPPTRISVDDGESLLKTKFTSEQRCIAFCLCLVDFTAFLSMSIIAPFFPREVRFSFIHTFD